MCHKFFFKEVYKPKFRQTSTVCIYCLLVIDWCLQEAAVSSRLCKWTNNWYFSTLPEDSSWTLTFGVQESKETPRTCYFLWRRGGIILQANSQNGIITSAALRRCDVSLKPWRLATLKAERWRKGDKLTRG